ncbi:hypothetical protein EVAR_93354_1 [Eumeta japonica]|uniref:Uncharacterized protein n=1 Tax=Eumeta variegata TaxID=151549 RepID=A0A4C1UU55_EUMVA|nr:hypothetical protein EVAR_93354_1 [Eumeta japonica]
MQILKNDSRHYVKIKAIREASAIHRPSSIRTRLVSSRPAFTASGARMRKGSIVDGWTARVSRPTDPKFIGAIPVARTASKTASRRGYFIKTPPRELLKYENPIEKRPNGPPGACRSICYYFGISV